MVLGNYQGPKEATKSGGQALSFACLAMQMPADWPGRSEALDREAMAYKATKEIDPNFPDPEKIFPPSKP